MTLPKTWAQIRAARGTTKVVQSGANSPVTQEIVEWDGEGDEAIIPVPLTSTLRPVLIAIDNQAGKALEAALEQLVRIDDALASLEIGAGQDGVLTITAEEAGDTGFSVQFAKLELDADLTAYVTDGAIVVGLGTTDDVRYGEILSGAVQVVTALEGVSVEVVTAAEPSASMAAAFDDDLLTITLGTDSEGAADPAKNTALLVAAQIDLLSDFTATVVGENTDVIAEMAPLNFGNFYVLDATKNTMALIAAKVSTVAGLTAEASGDGSGVFDDALYAQLLYAGPAPLTGGLVDVWAPLYDSDGVELSLAIGAEKARVFGPYEFFPRFLGGRIVLSAAEAPDDGDLTIVQVQEV